MPLFPSTLMCFARARARACVCVCVCVFVRECASAQVMVQFSSVENGINTFGKLYMCPSLSHNYTPLFALKTVPTAALSGFCTVFFYGRSSSTSAFYAALLQAAVGVMSV